MPDDRVRAAYTDRGLLLPGGSVSFSFADSIAFIEADERTGWLPALSLGITSGAEVGIHAPLRYDVAEAGWTTLDPRLHGAFGLVRGTQLELALRAGVLIAASSDAQSQLQASLPILFRPAKGFRFEAGLAGAMNLGGEFQAELRLPLALSVQLLPWMFAGLAAGPDLALGEEERVGVDGELRLGFTLQSQERAHLELLGRFFIENAGAPAGDAFADGAGTIVSVAFYPSVF